MKQHNKRGLLGALGGVVAAAALVLSGGVASAADVSTIDPESGGELVVTKLSNPPDDPSTGAQINVENPEPVLGAKFTIWKVDGIDLTTNAGWEAAEALNAATFTYNSTDDKWTFGTATTEEGQTEETDTDGQAIFGEGLDLELGLYLVQETHTPDGYIGNPAPFLVTVPMTDPVDLDSWMYKVFVYPKNQEQGEPTKTVTDATTMQANFGQASVNENVVWTIDSEVPEIPGTSTDPWVAPTAYKIVDKLDSALVYDSVTVQIGSGEDWAPLTVNTDYTVTTPDPDPTTGNENTLTIEFGSTGLAALKGAAAESKVVRTTVTTQVDKAAVAASTAGGLVIENDATIYINDAEKGKSVQTKPTTRFGNIDFNKVAKQGGAALKDAEFKVFASEEDARAGTNALRGDAIATSAIADGDTDAVVSLTGLRASNWANGVAVNETDYRVYWIVETKAPNGYELLAEPVPVVLLVDEFGNAEVKSVSWDGGALAVGDELSSIENVQHNAGFNLPLTGGWGTIWLMIAGGTLLAIVLVVARRRRAEEV